MAIPLNVNGASFSFPQQGDVGYAAQVTAWAKALTNGCLQLGGAYTLIADLDLSTFGVKAPYFTSKTANPAQSGAIRLAKTDTVAWRNNANSADLDLGITTGDALTFEGTQITGQPLLNVIRSTNQTPITTSVNVLFDTVITDTDSGYNAGIGVYTIPAGKGGHYLITTSLLVLQNAGTGTIAGNIAAGGNSVAGMGLPNVAAAGNGAMSASCIVNLAAGAQISVNVQTSGGNLTVQAFSRDTQLSIKRLV